MVLFLQPADPLRERSGPVRSGRGASRTRSMLKPKENFSPSSGFCLMGSEVRFGFGPKGSVISWTLTEPLWDQDYGPNRARGLIPGWSIYSLIYINQSSLQNQPTCSAGPDSGSEPDVGLLMQFLLFPNKDVKFLDVSFLFGWFSPFDPKLFWIKTKTEPEPEAVWRPAGSVQPNPLKLNPKCWTDLINRNRKVSGSVNQL